MTKKIIYKILTNENPRMLEAEVQTEIENLQNYNWFFMKIDTICTPTISYFNWIQTTELHYTAVCNFTYNDL